MRLKKSKAPAEGAGRDLDALRRAARKLKRRILDNRRAIHANPERGLETPATQKLVIEELERIGVRGLRKGRELTSVVAEIKGEAPGRAGTVVLRADMDALPIRERSGVACASRNEGVMHACGHDAHTAMLLGAAELLTANRASFAGTVRLMFQPGEEGFAGARRMLEEGVLEGAAAAFAIHVEPSRRAGEIHARIGPMMAADSVFSVTFTGAGGHASMPHHARDPIPAIGPFVDAVAHVAARETDPDDRAVISVTRIQAGTAANVIPATAKCSGTFRTLSRSRRKRIAEQIQRVAEGVAASRGLEAEVKVAHNYPPTVNHELGVRAAFTAARALGLPTCEMPSPVMGAEDFSYVLEKVPGAIVFLGAQTEGGGPLHSDRMKIDERVLPEGAALYAGTALELLAPGNVK